MIMTEAEINRTFLGDDAPPCGRRWPRWVKGVMLACAMLLAFGAGMGSYLWWHRDEPQRAVVLDLTDYKYDPAPPDEGSWAITPGVIGCGVNLYTKQVKPVPPDTKITDSVVVIKNGRTEPLTIHMRTQAPVQPAEGFEALPVEDWIVVPPKVTVKPHSQTQIRITIIIPPILTPDLEGNKERWIIFAPEETELVRTEYACRVLIATSNDAK